jgi:hypothetical protein
LCAAFRALNYQQLIAIGAAENLPADSLMPNGESNDTSRRASLVALGVVVCLFLLGWLLAHELNADSKLEDCVMSGRTNCAPIDTRSR